MKYKWIFLVVLMFFAAWGFEEWYNRPAARFARARAEAEKLAPEVKAMQPGLAEACNKDVESDDCAQRRKKIGEKLKQLEAALGTMDYLMYVVKVPDNPKIHQWAHEQEANALDLDDDLTTLTEAESKKITDRTEKSVKKFEKSVEKALKEFPDEGSKKQK